MDRSNTEMPLLKLKPIRNRSQGKPFSLYLPAASIEQQIHLEFVKKPQGYAVALTVLFTNSQLYASCRHANRAEERFDALEPTTNKEEPSVLLIRPIVELN